MLSPAPQFRCTNQARANILSANATFTGVTSTQILGLELTDVDLQLHVVLLHLPNPVQTGGSGGLLVQGGVLITSLVPIWVATGADVANGVAPPAGAPADQLAEQQELVAAGVLPTDAAALSRTLVLRTRDPVLNGIDFIEVLDQELPAPAAPGDLDLRQSVLLVHLFLPVPPATGNPNTSFGAGNIDIEGGVRITNVSAVWAVAADTLSAGPVTVVPEPERDQILATNVFLSLDALALSKTLIVRTNGPGDFSSYELSIEAVGTSESDPGDTDVFNPPFFGFDRQLSRVTFSFKIECPTDFDCKPVDTCVPAAPQAPVIDYLSKDYASFRSLMFDRMAQTMPQWQETNVADIGVTLVELLSFAADQLSYFQDSVATEAYLGTAQQRPSLRRHARLLDYTPREGTNARTYVHFDVQDPSTGPASVLPAGSPLLTAITSTTPQPPAIVFTPQPELTDLVNAAVGAAVDAGAQVFQTMQAITLREAHNQIGLHTWGDEGICCLPAGATRATLIVLNDTGFDPPRPPLPIDLNPLDDGAIKVGALLAFVEVNSSEQNAPPDPKHRQVVRLTKVRAATVDPLFQDLNGNPLGVVDVEWSTDDALQFPLCLGTVDNAQGTVPISVAQGNIVLADHGQSVSETLPAPPSDPIDSPPFRPRLTNGPLTFQGQVVDADSNIVLFDPTAAAAAALAPDPQQAVPSILLFPTPSSGEPDCGDPELLTDPETWLPVSDLLEAGQFSKQFVVEIQNDGDAQLRFGDDTLGERPLDVLTACYRIGNGAGGNIGADALVQVVTTFAGVQSVNNVVAATGGTDQEPLEEIRLAAPQAFRVQERAVTSADYAEVALRHPGVQRAVATRRFTGSWYTMFVAVDRLGGVPVDDAFKAEFASFLERFRLAGYDLEIQGAIPVPLDIELTVCVQPGFFRFNVKQALLDVLSNRDLPNGQRGFFHPDNFTFGQPVFLSQIIAVVLAVPGVGQVLTGPGQLTFKRLDQVVDPKDAADGVLRMGPLEIAQLDNDPNEPENGQLLLDMQGGA